jgi:hypothetical protein
MNFSASVTSANVAHSPADFLHSHCFASSVAMALAASRNAPTP